MTLLTAFFFFGLLTGLQAQDKYDFIMAYVDQAKPTIHIVQNDVPEKIIETGKKTADIVGQNEKLLSAISQLTGEGWEVINASATTNILTNIFYLKRKKKS